MARDLPPSSPFAGDDGSPDVHLAPALALDDDGERLRAVVTAMADARVLVPVVAHLDEPSGAGQKQAGAAMVTVSTPDGRAAIPVFSGLDSLRAWRSDARPVPVPATRAALASVTEADGLLVLDPAGPRSVLVPRPAVWALAQGQAWVPPETDEQLRTHVVAALTAVPDVVAVELHPGPAGATQVVLDLPAGLSRERVGTITAAAQAELARSDLVARRIDAVQLRVRAC